MVNRLKAKTILVLLMIAAAGAVQAAGDFDQALDQARQLSRQDPSEAVVLMDRLIDENSATAPLGQLARLYGFRAELVRDLGLFEEAGADAQRARSLAEDANQPDLEAETLRVLGTIQAESGDIDAALTSFHRAWTILEGSQAQAAQLRVAIALGVGHQMLENHPRSVEYFDRGLDLARTLDRPAQEATLLGNLAITRAQMGDPESSLALHQQALEIFLRLGHRAGEASQRANLCERYVDLGRIDRAEAVCFEAAEQLEALGNSRLLAGVRGSIGTLYELQGDLDAALEAYAEALEQSEGTIPTVERMVLEKLARLQIKRGEPDAALAAYRRYMAAREALWEERNRQYIEELEVQYDLKERERELELSRARSELQSETLDQRTRLLVLATISALLMVALVAIVVRNNRARARLQVDLAERNEALEEAVETISRLATRDPLTDLRNRRSFIDRVQREILRSRRTPSDMYILMIDIDNFKRLNDEHGHAFGDRVLQEIAGRLSTDLRQEDVVCRWGGEEFVVLLADASVDEARALAERMRRAVAQSDIQVDEVALRITVTVGVARLGDDLDEALDAADQAMYEGKRSGRNQVVFRDTLD